MNSNFHEMRFPDIDYLVRYVFKEFKGKKVILCSETLKETAQETAQSRDGYEIITHPQIKDGDWWINH